VGETEPQKRPHQGDLGDRKRCKRRRKSKGKEATGQRGVPAPMVPPCKQKMEFFRCFFWKKKGGGGEKETRIRLQGLWGNVVLGAGVGGGRKIQPAQ